MSFNLDYLTKVDFKSAFTSSAATTATAFALGKLGVNLVAYKSAAVVSGVTSAVQLLANNFFSDARILAAAFPVGIGLGVVAQKAVADKLGEVLGSKGVAVITVAMLVFSGIIKTVPALFSKKDDTESKELTGDLSGKKKEVEGAF